MKSFKLSYFRINSNIIAFDEAGFIADILRALNIFM
jgi:hypothetical protein